MVTLTYILAAVVLLGLCIFVHELGHLLGGKMVGIKAEVFSIGYGKGFIKKKWGDTTYQITLIPFGGYCKFYGEDPNDTRQGKPYEFLSASPLKRVVTVLMGPLFNLFFGIILFFIMNLHGYPVETNKIYIPEYLTKGEYISPAYEAGLRTGDTIVAINNEQVTGFTDIQSKVAFSKGSPITVRAVRGSDEFQVTIAPKKYTKKGYYTIGVMPYGNRVLVMGILPDSPAQKAGLKEMDEIIEANGTQFHSPEEFTQFIRRNPQKELSLTISRGGRIFTLPITPHIKEVLTIRQFTDARFPNETYTVTVDSLSLIKSAANKGKVRINGKPVQSFENMKHIINNSKEMITLQTPGGAYKGIMQFESYGFVGIETAISPENKFIQYGVYDAFVKSLVDPFDFIALNFKGLGMMFSGELDVRQNLSGPIRIAKIAGDTAYYRGVSAFIILMAKISIILMVMNLLPIPMVDGSFILIFLYEAITRRAFSQKLLEKIQMIGFAILVLLGIFVIFNDLSFLPFFKDLF